MPACIKQNKKPAKAIKDTLAQSPSIPSMRLMALTKYTIRKMVNGAPTQNGISWMPQNPYRSLIYNPAYGRNRPATIWKDNLALAPIPNRSSIIPAAYISRRGMKKQTDLRLNSNCFSSTELL